MYQFLLKESNLIMTVFSVSCSALLISLNTQNESLTVDLKCVDLLKPRPVLVITCPVPDVVDAHTLKVEGAIGEDLQLYRHYLNYQLSLAGLFDRYKI